MGVGGGGKEESQLMTKGGNGEGTVSFPTDNGTI